MYTSSAIKDRPIMFTKLSRFGLETQISFIGIVACFLWQTSKLSWRMNYVSSSRCPLSKPYLELPQSPYERKREEERDRKRERFFASRVLIFITNSHEPPGNVWSVGKSCCLCPCLRADNCVGGGANTDERGRQSNFNLDPSKRYFPLHGWTSNPFH